MKKLAITLALLTPVLLLATSAPTQADEILLPIISVTPASYDFGFVPVGALAQGNLVVHNLGEAPLLVTAVKTRAPFADGVSAPFMVPGGGSRRVQIAFAPGQPIQYSGVCTFLSNAANDPAYSVPLTGWGYEE
jgi:hypothetical protein